MLGFNSTRQPIKGKLAREIREQLSRIETKSLSEQDKEAKVLQCRNSKYTLVEE